ncbi:MAG: uroporphyrin-III C-methyltransferase / precorrin-2 dehydrogenase / sirohydrochlorin ferrochelatase [Gammaproteobacteria bacterium]|nr:uroporphyrin-III C-methyltransferase / precorrin-2 dehydrogenase / sirohydrochlorin ferrochelatase [Gammaproteobacteria bacterium]
MRLTSENSSGSSTGLRGFRPGMDYLPIFLQLQARPVLVVGGGRVAARKVDLLRRTGAQITIVAPELVDELRELATKGDVQHLETVFASEHVTGAAAVIAATGVTEVNAAVSAAAREQNIPVNVVDDPTISTFIFPAIVDRSPILIAISSGGQAPVLARRIRAQMEALLPARLGALARFMGDRRKAVKRALRTAARRSFWERIVGGVVGARIFAGDEVAAGKEFERELRTTNLTRSSGTGALGLGECYLIGAGPGDPDLLTLRALQLLQQADVILYDRLVPATVLERARRDAERVFVGKQPGNHTTQERINELLVHYARLGLRVARLKGGDPFIFGRGGEEIEVLAAHGIPYVVVPGITAALGAAASANIPLTHRKLAQSVTFVTGHVLDDDSLDWNSLAGARQTVVFYMGVGHLPQIVAKLQAAGAPADHPVAVVERATLPEQRTLRGTLETIVSTVQAAKVAPPALLIVGDVTALAAADSLIGSELGALA